MYQIKGVIILLVLVSFISEPGFGQTVGFVCNKGIAGNSSSDLYLFERHDADSYSLPPNKLLAEASAAMQFLCQKNKFLFIDSYNYFKSKGIPQHNEDDIMAMLKTVGKATEYTLA